MVKQLILFSLVKKLILIFSGFFSDFCQNDWKWPNSARFSLFSRVKLDFFLFHLLPKKLRNNDDHVTKSNFGENDQKIQPDQSQLLSTGEVENQSEGEELAKATKVS